MKKKKSKKALRDPKLRKAEEAADVAEKQAMRAIAKFERSLVKQTKNKKKHELSRKRKFKLERIRTQDGKVGGMTVDNTDETADYLMGGLS